MECFFSDKLASIAFIGETMNKYIYVNILAHIFFLFINTLNANGITDILFQQNNVSLHIAKKSILLFENRTTEHRFSIMIYLLNFFDMNSIEHL